MRSVLSKRGQEMSISTLVLIVLAIIVLVLVVIGFTGGWSNLWDRISNLGGGKENVQLVVQACGIACSSDSQYDYCSRLREVNFGKGNVPANFVATDSDGDGKIKVTCGSLAKANVGGLVCDSFASTSGCEREFDDQATAPSQPSEVVGPPAP
ncbi:MAG: hypothetical protein AABX53_02145 [Nanoarchaeota archaeon]